MTTTCDFVTHATGAKPLANGSDDGVTTMTTALRSRKQLMVAVSTHSAHVVEQAVHVVPSLKYVGEQVSQVVPSEHLAHPVRHFKQVFVTSFLYSPSGQVINGVKQSPVPGLSHLVNSSDFPEVPALSLSHMPYLPSFILMDVLPG